MTQTSLKLIFVIFVSNILPIVGMEQSTITNTTTEICDKNESAKEMQSLKTQFNTQKKTILELLSKQENLEKQLKQKTYQYECLDNDLSKITEKLKEKIETLNKEYQNLEKQQSQTIDELNTTKIKLRNTENKLNDTENKHITALKYNRCLLIYAFYLFAWLLCIYYLHMNYT